MMEKVLYYISKDGREFESENMCKMHEAEILLKEREIIFWKDNASVISNFHDVLFFATWCYTPKGKKQFNAEESSIINDALGWFPPNDPGFYYLEFLKNDSAGGRIHRHEWVHIEDKIYRLENEIDFLKSVKERLDDLFKHDYFNLPKED